MLTFYLSTVVIWMIIFLSLMLILVERIDKNGWLTGHSNKGSVKDIVHLFLISTIPILRLVIVIIFITMASVNKEEFYKKTGINKK